MNNKEKLYLAKTAGLWNKLLVGGGLGATLGGGGAALAGASDQDIAKYTAKGGIYGGLTGGLLQNLENTRELDELEESLANPDAKEKERLQDEASEIAKKLDRVTPESHPRAHAQLTQQYEELVGNHE
jgi:hypothetical protein